MPNYKKHQKFGFFLVGLVLLLSVLIFKIVNGSMDIKHIIFGSIIIFIFSVLPDIDHRISKIRNIAYILMWSFMLVFSFSLLILLYAKGTSAETLILTFTTMSYIILAQIVVSSISLLILMLKHRGITHSYIAATLLSLPLLFIDVFSALVGFVAYSSHLLLDNAPKK